jgi:hypothetical protein
MRKLQSFDSFGALNEEQKLSNLDLYRPVALGVAEAFSIYGYYISLLEEKVNQDDWDRLISSITSIRDYEGKWRQIIGLSKKLHGILQSFSSQKNRGLGNWLMKIEDIGQETTGITQALERFKTASDLLTEGLPEEKIQNRLKMIDKALVEINPYVLLESYLFEKEGQFAPSEYSILMTADRLASQIVNMRLTLRYLAQTLPQIKSSAEQTEANVLDPLAEQIKKFLDSGIMPKETLPVSKSVEKAYADRGWVIKSQVDKYMVDAFEQLSKIETQIIDVYKRIEGYKNQAVDKYQGRNDATEFIDNANNILKGIKDRIIKRMQIERLNKKSGEIIKGSTTNQLKRDSESDAVLNTDQLKDYLKRKYQTGS